MSNCKEERKIDRRCNNCGDRLKEDSPNWFQCSEQCRSEVWDRNKPKDNEDDK